jgi:hypothetical protein
MSHNKRKPVAGFELAFAKYMLRFLIGIPHGIIFLIIGGTRLVPSESGAEQTVVSLFALIFALASLNALLGCVLWSHSLQRLVKKQFVVLTGFFLSSIAINVFVIHLIATFWPGLHVGSAAVAAVGMSVSSWIFSLKHVFSPEDYADADAVAWVVRMRDRQTRQLHEVQQLHAELRRNSRCSDLDEQRLQTVEAATAQYLSSIEADPEQSFHVYNKAFYAPERIKVTLGLGSGSFYPSVPAVHAQLDLLIVSYRTRLNLLKAEAAADLQRALGREIEADIVNSGLK